jgi:hypothetical protein
MVLVSVGLGNDEGELRSDARSLHVERYSIEDEEVLPILLGMSHGIADVGTAAGVPAACEKALLSVGGSCAEHGEEQQCSFAHRQLLIDQHSGRPSLDGHSAQSCRLEDRHIGEGLG